MSRTASTDSEPTTALILPSSAEGDASLVFSQSPRSNTPTTSESSPDLKSPISSTSSSQPEAYTSSKDPLTRKLLEANGDESTLIVGIPFQDKSIPETDIIDVLDDTHPSKSKTNKSKDIPAKSDKMATSLEDIASLRLWKGIIAEFVGTLLLTMVGCGSCINLRGENNVTSPVVQIALCFGLSVGTIVWSICHVSGGHINPAVTAAMLATRKISLAKGVFFVLFQLIGAVVGAGILLGLTPSDYRSSLGMTMVSDKVSVAQAVGIEMFVTFVLVLTVFASCDGKRKDLNGSAPLTIGLSVTMCHLWAIDYTGSSMNTARSFGPALVMGEWENHWVYWLGPIVGGVGAGLLYEHLFAVNASLVKAKACLLSSSYDDEKYKAKKIKVRIIEEDPAEEDDPNDEYPLTEKDGRYSSNASNV